MAEKVAWYRRCTRCVHGKKEIGPRLCGPCILGNKDFFKDRGKEWPAVYREIDEKGSNSDVSSKTPNKA